MGRQPIHSEQSVRATALAMLAEGAQGAPVTSALFRRVLSARKLRERLGGGDLSTLARILKAFEAEATRDAATRNTIPDLPENVANLMRAVWQAALDAQAGAIEHITQEAARSVATAEDGRDEASALVALLRTELNDLRKDLATRDETIGGLRAELSESARQLKRVDSEQGHLSAQLAVAQRARDADRHDFAAQLAATRAQYDGLNRQLLEQTDGQRQTWVEAKKALERQLRATEERVTELRADRQRLLDERSNRRSSA
jgi:chromosome segregation ATPase